MSDSTQTRLDHPSSLKGSQVQDVKVLDMTRVRDDVELAKTGPRDYRNLHRLHEKINPALPTRIRSAKSASSRPREQEPRRSSVHGSTGDHQFKDQAFSDYGDEWTEDLPSIFDLLKKKPDIVQEPDSDLLNPADDEYRAKEVEISNDNNSEMEDTFDDELSDVEAAMIDLENTSSMTNSRHAKVEKVPQSKPYDDNQTIHGIEQDIIQSSRDTEDPRTSNNKRTLTAALPINERLFLSTDSPERPLKVQKRTHEDSPTEITFSDAIDDQTCKDSHLLCDSMAAHQPLIQHSSPRETDESSLTHEIATSGADTLSARQRFSNGGRPLPAWVDDFDPDWVEEFLREYGDLVILI